MKVAWTSGKHHVRQRGVVCGGNDKGAE